METWEMWVQSLGWVDPLEEVMAIHSSILAWRIPWTEEPGGLRSIGSQRLRHDWTDLAATQLMYWNSLFYYNSIAVLSGNMLLNLHYKSSISIRKKRERIKYFRPTIMKLLFSFWNFNHEGLLYSSKHKALTPKFSSVQSLSRVRFFVTPWTAACQASLSITNTWSLFKLMFIESVMPSNHLILCHPLLLLSSVFPSIRVFPNKSVLRIRWPKYWSFSLIISPSNEYSGLISFRMDWLDCLAVQETLCLLQHYSSKASILWCSAFFTVQLSHPYMTTGKTIALTRRTFVGKVTSLLFNMLSRLVIAFLPRGKHLLISWLQSPSAVILESRKIKSVTVSIVSPSICHEVMGPDVMRPKYQT